ncbi:ABC transporter ATP-binding protein [Acidiplasma aeolicum]|jgi:ABC-2 type transport system ATP-binding protein|uniref:ABC transporter ATP-binding protein n=1 Tax=Acidiplasma aeolicum TaxID=507754 RepID=UPI003715E646
MYDITAKNISKTFKNFTALDSINLNINGGERVSILGPNGAGKSTLLKILTGILKPDAGCVKINGLDPLTSEAKKYIGYLPEDAYPYPNLSVISNLEYIGSIRGVENLEERINYLLDYLEIYEYRKKRVLTLSRGNRQKLSIALAVIHNPKILLLDEPLNYLDIPTQRKVGDLLNGLNATMVISTHIMEIARRLSGKVIIINKGRIKWEGTMPELENMAGENESIETMVERLMLNVG